VVFALVACGVAWTAWGEGGSDAANASGAWRKAPDSPLSPREHAFGIWTGRESLVIAGSDGPPCPPGASCRAQKRPPLRDGAAFNPRTRAWRRIADAPVGFEFADGAVVGRTVFIATPGNDSRPGSPPAVLAYRVDRDRWRRIPSPPNPRHNYTLVAAGDRLVVYSRGDGHREPPGYVLRPGGRSWRALPPDPLVRTRAQSIAWTGRELVLFKSASGESSASEPPPARAAALDLATRRWRRLPDSDTVPYGPYWLLAGSRLINPSLEGGILEFETGTWSDLPDPPPSGPFDFGTGVLTKTRGYYTAPGGWVLDTAGDRWIEIPRLDGDRSGAGGRSIASAGRSLLLFGGYRFDRRHPAGKLLGAAWIWTPPR